MEITVSQKQGRVPVTVFHIKGDVDTTTYEQLQAQARQAFESGTRNLLLDLAEVPYVSSAGIRALNNMFNLLRADTPEESDEAIGKGLRDGTFKSPHLKLLNPTSRVTGVLSVAGVDMFLETHHDLQAAIASF
ncbi:MAG: STAS domain-containing protein [Chloroflexi bacterium]|nr:STAS domain-containing protein [Chloroflexota bacterium]